MEKHSAIQKSKSLSIILLSGISLLLMALIALYANRLFPEQQPITWLMGLTLGLFLVELTAILVVYKRIVSSSPQRMVSIYMLLKGVKLLLFLAVSLVYVMAVPVETKRFVLSAVAIYFVYILVDTIILSGAERAFKLEK